MRTTLRQFLAFPFIELTVETSLRGRTLVCNEHPIEPHS
jgi:hypothetical protein